MSKRTKGCLIGGIFLYVLLATIIILVMNFQRQDFHSAATASRDTFGYKDGHFGLLKHADRETDADWPAAEVMMEPVRIEGEKGKFLYDFSTEAKPGEVTPPSRWNEGFLGDDAVALAAFATWVPGPDDPIGKEGWTAPLTLRDPATLDPIDSARLAGLGLPESFTTFLPPKTYQTPILRLVFLTEGMEYPRAIGSVAGDARTGARITYNLKNDDDGSARHEVSGKWLRIDTNLLLWHDTPLKCHVEFLTGTPETAELAVRPGAQIHFGDRLRLQWLTTAEHSMSVNSWVGSFEPAASLPEPEKEAIRKRFSNRSARPEGLISFSPKDPPEAAAKLFVRTSSRDYLTEHCGVIGEAGISWDWRQEESEEGVVIASTPGQTPDRPLQLVFIPSVTEWTGEIPGLPDMPNPRTIEDLFDCVLPRITLPEDHDDAETQLLGYIGVGAQLAWESEKLWKTNPPAALPTDRTFRDTTPQQLLDWYLDHTPGSYVRYDEEDLTLHFNEEEGSWWKRMTEGMRTLYYETLYGSPLP